MQFKANATVLDSEGKHFGHVRRVVIDPRNRDVVDLVVRTGTLLTEDRVVPIEQVAESDGDHVRLNLDGKAADQLPPFEATYYVPASPDDANIAVDALPPASYWYP